MKLIHGTITRAENKVRSLFLFITNIMCKTLDAKNNIIPSYNCAIQIVALSIRLRNAEQNY